MDEIASDYFDSSKNSKAYFYKIGRLGLKDTLGVRRKMVNLFKTAYMDKKDSIDLSKWMAMKKHGYCFSPTNVSKNNTIMAMDVISKDGLIRGVVVGSVPSCANAKVDTEFVQKFPPPKKRTSSGGGC